MADIGKPPGDGVTLLAKPFGMKELQKYLENNIGLG